MPTTERSGLWKLESLLVGFSAFRTLLGTFRETDFPQCRSTRLEQTKGTGKNPSRFSNRCRAFGLMA
jgi:hypothetical protein